MLVAGGVLRRCRRACPARGQLMVMRLVTVWLPQPVFPVNVTDTVQCPVLPAENT